MATPTDFSRAPRSQEFARLQTELRRNVIMAMIGSLVAGFAHEARNPLFGISAVLDALAARFGEGSEYAEHFTLLRRDVKRLNDLMHDLLEFGRPSAEGELTPRPLAPVLGDAVAECAALCADREVTVEIPAPGDDLRAPGFAGLPAGSAIGAQKAFEQGPWRGAPGRGNVAPRIAPADSRSLPETP